jgi:predicted Fe-Mo cluster-binding NifX family protein
MKIIFTAEGTDWDSKINPRFGRTEWFVVYDEETQELSNYDNSEVKDQAHGAGPKAAQKIFELGGEVLITGNGPGSNAASIVEKAGITCYIGAGEMNLKEAYDAYKNNQLKKF